MSEEEIKKIAKREFINNVMENLDSALIFTYIQNLEQKLQQKENIIKEVREIFKDYGEKEDIVGYTMYNITGEMLIKLLEILDDEKV